MPGRGLTSSEAEAEAEAETEAEAEAEAEWTSLSEMTSLMSYIGV